MIEASAESIEVIAALAPPVGDAEIAEVVDLVMPDAGQSRVTHGQIGDEQVVIQVAEKIRFGHKFAIRTIPRGEPILKYGQPIGVATEEIAAGRHVHVHNLESTRGRGDK